ncbi:MAG: hypothetical protein HOV80_12795, partial [Polyangiaceae bacterium]|nr:hypothetical protein [Polyangiaceae bacterium]
SVALVACYPAKDKATANPETAASQATAPASASASTSAAAAITPEAPPLLDLAEQFPVPESYSGVYALDGAIIVSSRNRYGRLGDQGVEWLKTYGGHPAYGETIVMSVSGVYPDGVDVITSLSNGRAPLPSYSPATGQGSGVTFSPGGGMGWVAGIARVGASTLVAGYDNMEGGHQILHVRGPKLERKHLSLKEGGCSEEDFPKAALETHDFGATKAGTVLAFGDLCGKESAVEVWAAGGSSKPKIVKPPGGLESYGNDLLQGPGDVLWIANSRDKQILEYKDGGFSQLPALPGDKKLVKAFVDRDTLHATDGNVIYKLDGGAWKTAATLVWSSDFSHLLLRDGTYWGVSASKLVKLVPGKSNAYTEGCKTPFVQLYDVSDKAEPTYKFPTTTKALATFADIEKVGLVEYYEGRRRLGITVPSKEVGDAVIAHVKATMKDEDPKLLCYEPKKPRAIEVTKAK